MPPRRKLDAPQIEAFWNGLARAPWVDARHRIWMPYVYRFDDVQAVASILQAGAIYSRERCERLGLLQLDTANPDIIEHSPWAHGYVRLYFRPMTPTQYRNEGIRRPADRTSGGAHCPVPVFLVFDAVEILTQWGSEFTNGNWGTGRSNKGASADFLRSLPWESVYHYGVIRHPFDIADVTFRRNAEILIRNELELASLRAIVCRSGAERETLLYLLGDAAIEWEGKIRLQRLGEKHFYQEWLYVTSVALRTGTDLDVAFHPPRDSEGPFEIRIEVWDDRTDELVLNRAAVKDPVVSKYALKLPTEVSKARVRITVEDALAYHGVVSRRAFFR
jgi:hypothetical protein